jgi:hypothetical protein
VPKRKVGISHVVVITMDEILSIFLVRGFEKEAKCLLYMGFHFLWLKQFDSVDILFKRVPEEEGEFTTGIMLNLAR